VDAIISKFESLFSPVWLQLLCSEERATRNREGKPKVVSRSKRVYTVKARAFSSWEAKLSRFFPAMKQRNFFAGKFRLEELDADK
jgi:hypothetical protein